MRFQPTLPVRGATLGERHHAAVDVISTHAPRAGSDDSQQLAGADRLYFNPRSPCGERPPPAASPPARPNFNPRSPCGERPTRSWPTAWRTNFNPRSPCGERPGASEPSTSMTRFQPTLPVRGATLRAPRRSCCRHYFNPRSPCGERLALQLPVPLQEISTHAPRAGSDPDRPPGPDRGAISTHAPRAGSDRSACDRRRWRDDFNPRSPCGERRITAAEYSSRKKFQPTLPVRGATLPVLHCIAIPLDFNPRSPCGERLQRAGGRPPQGHISTHAPRAGSDASTMSLSRPFL